MISAPGGKFRLIKAKLKRVGAVGAGYHVRAAEGGAQLLSKGRHGGAIDELGFLEYGAQGVVEGGLQSSMLSRQIQHANGGGRRRSGGQWVSG